MDREKLTDFVVLSDTLNFTEAAERLYLSQSALSKRIKALEKDLGRELFVRDTRNIKLSDFGAQFLPFARQILTGYESADMFLERYSGSSDGQITLGTINNPECYHIDKIFIGFEAEYPGIKLNLREGHLMNLHDMFHSGKFDLYCTCDRIIHKNTGFIPVGKGYLVALCPLSDPLADKEVFYPSDLAGRNLMLPSEVDPFYKAVIKAFEDAGITPNVVYNGAGISSLSLVKAGVGISIMPVEIARAYADKDIKVVDFRPEVSYEYGLGFKPKKTLSEQEKLFVEYVDRYGKELVK